MREERVAERLHDGGHGVQRENDTELLGHQAQREDDGRRVHPELHQKVHEVREIAVFGRERRQPEAEAEADERGVQDEQRQGQKRQVGVNAGALRRRELEIEVEPQKRDKLQAERQQVGHERRERDDETRKIDLGEQPGVRDERGRDGGQGLREVRPGKEVAEVEHLARDAVGWDFGDFAEDDGEHEGGDERLDDEPGRPEHGLLVFGDEVAADHEVEQVAVVDERPPVYDAPSAGGFDYLFVVGHGWYGCRIKSGMTLLPTGCRIESGMTYSHDVFA